MGGGGPAGSETTALLAEKANNGGDAVPVPQPRQWTCLSASAMVARVFLVFVGCVLASGPLSGFPTIEPLLVERGVFFRGNSTADMAAQTSQLSGVYTISMGISVGAYFFAGYLYDRFGARVNGLAGSVGVAAGLALLALGITRPSLNWLVYVGFTLADFSGYANSMALYGFMWTFGMSWQVTIIGLANSSYVASALMGFALVWLTDHGFSLEYALLVFAGLAVVSGIIMAMATPSLSTFYNEADAALGFKTPRKVPSLMANFRDLWDVMGQKKTETVMFYMGTMAIYIQALYWFSVYEPFAVALYGETEGVKVANALTLIYGFGGFAITPFLGKIMDKTGFVGYYASLVIGLAIFTVCLFFQPVAVQFVSLVIGVISMCSWGNVIGKWAVIYAPPQLYGTYFGFTFGTMGVLQLVINLATPIIAKALLPPGLTTYHVIFAIFGSLSVGFSLLLAIRLCVKGMPATPPLPRDRNGGGAKVDSPARDAEASIQAPE